MSFHESLIDHYAPGGLLTSIEDGLASIGKTVESVVAADLVAVDEFHVGGRPATEHLLDQLGLQPTHEVLDVGCGIGGPARCAAGRVRRVTGIDLTPEYAAVGNSINRWLGLTESIELQSGTALAMPFDDARFDAAYMLHVGMNIADKPALMTELARVLRPDGVFGVYDVMAIDGGRLGFPLPWSSTEATSHVSTPDEYREAAASAGMTLIAENNRRPYAIEFFDRMGAARTGSSEPPPLGLHLLMGPRFGEKIQNMAAAIRSNQVAPVEMVFQRTS